MKKIRASAILIFTIIISTLFISYRMSASNIIQIPRSNSSIQLDGILNEGEWNEAWQISVENGSNQTLFKIYIKNDDNFLYIAVDDIFDISENKTGGDLYEDLISFVFDTDNNQGLTEEHDDAIGIWGSGTVAHSVVNTSLPNKYIYVSDLTSFTIKINFTTSFNSYIPHWTAEFQIDLSIFSSKIFGFVCIIAEIAQGRLFPYPITINSMTNQSAFQRFEFTTSSDDTLLYVGIGVGIGIGAIVGIGIFISFKKRTTI